MFDFVAVDFETANARRSSACSIGIAAVKGLKVVETYHSLIRPEFGRFSGVNIRIHGITPDMVKKRENTCRASARSVEIS